MASERAKAFAHMMRWDDWPDSLLDMPEEELAEELDRFAAEDPDTGRPGSFWRALPEWMRNVLVMEAREAAARNSGVPMGAAWAAAADVLEASGKEKP